MDFFDSEVLSAGVQMGRDGEDTGVVGLRKGVLLREGGVEEAGVRVHWMKIGGEEEMSDGSCNRHQSLLQQ